MEDAKLQKYQLVYFYCSTGMGIHIPTATVKVNIDGRLSRAAETGISVLDAICKALAKAVNLTIQVEWHDSPTICRGQADAVEFRLRLVNDGKTTVGYGMALDYNMAAAQAYVNGLNQLMCAPEPTTPVELDQKPHNHVLGYN